MSYIEIKNLTKKIKNNLILDNINLSLEEGKIYGFWGRNGSGKTMLFRAISGLISPTEGEIYINDKLLGKEISFPESIGIVIENTGLWQEYNAFDNLKILSEIKKVIDDDKINSTIKRIGLDEHRDKKYRKYSLGMKQKLAIGQAIMEEPKLIILDEPTNALDEESVETVRKIILEEKERGAVILIASHNRDDIEFLSDIKFKIDKGKIAEYK